MRKILFLYLTLFLNLLVCPAQTPDKAIVDGAAGVKNTQSQKRTQKGADIGYRLGTKSVLIPAPEGYEEASSQIDDVRRFFEATEAPDLDLLAVHVPVDILERLKTGERFNLSLYTKVSVPKRLREIDISLSDFSKRVSALQGNSAKVFDFTSPEMKAILQGNNKSMSDFFEREAKMDLSQPVNLGEIAKTDESYGVLLLFKVKFEIDGKQEELFVLGGVSMVRIKQRLVFIYTYRRFNSNEDAELIRNFTKQWLGQIIKVNQS